VIIAIRFCTSYCYFCCIFLPVLLVSSPGQITAWPGPNELQGSTSASSTNQFDISIRHGNETGRLQWSLLKRPGPSQATNTTASQVGHFRLVTSSVPCHAVTVGPFCWEMPATTTSTTTTASHTNEKLSSPD